jgi:hypothetical protein
MSVRDREDAVVARLQALAPHLDGEPDPAFRDTTRARLVAMAAVRSPAPDPVSPLRRLLTEGAAAPARWRTRLTAGLAGAAVAVTALAGVVALAADARPGDVLYDLKRGTEQTKLALAGDARGQALLDLASTRLDEVRWLVEDGATALPAAGYSGAGEVVLAAGADATLVVETLGTMDAETAEGAAWLTDRAVETDDAGPLTLLADWAATQSEGLAALRDQVPPAAADDVDASLGLLSDIATRVTGLDSSLDCPAGPATAGADELGPVPALCLPDGSTSPGAGGNGPGTATGDGDGSATGSGTSVPGATLAPQLPGTPVPSVGGGGVPGLPGGTGGGDAPTSVLPTLPKPSLPSASLPSPSLSLPKLPGASPGTSTSVGTALPKVDVCLGPIVIGDC